MCPFFFHIRLHDTQNSLMAVELEKGRLKSDEKKMTDSNLLLKNKYDTLRERCRLLDGVYRKENLHGSDVLEDMIRLKEQAAARMNHRNEKRLRLVSEEVELSFFSEVDYKSYFFYIRGHCEAVD